MTLKEECELLRGAPILLKTPVEQVPCNETSDPEKLCKNPVVSVHMLTYNHEPYIREAIEGVMMQETDFEFELVIGEDASQDKTREICFEYQKRYPDKIRVLWSEENVTKPYGGNGSRVSARCRGEFIALCEGDDYWIDPLKLQKQVDVMRKYPAVGLVFSSALSRVGCEPKLEQLQYHKFKQCSYAKETLRNMILNWKITIPTASTLIRKDLGYRLEITNWRLNLGDTTCWLNVSNGWDTYSIPDSMVVYRINPTSITKKIPFDIMIDGAVVRYWFNEWWHRPVPRKRMIKFCILQYFRLFVNRNKIYTIFTPSVQRKLRCPYSLKFWLFLWRFCPQNLSGYFNQLYLHGVWFCLGSFAKHRVQRIFHVKRSWVEYPLKFPGGGGGISLLNGDFALCHFQMQEAA